MPLQPAPPPRSTTQTDRSRRRRTLCATLATAAAALLLQLPAFAATVVNLYEATVQLTERTERGQALAFQDALRQVLVRITGRRDAGVDPALAPLVNDARRYVLQFRVVAPNQFVAGFDGARVQRAVVDAGLPLWGHERPATLVLLVAGENARTLLAPGTAGEAQAAVVRGAQLRGLPLLWPDSSRPVNVADVAGAAPEALRAIGERYGADAVLAGTVAGSGPGAMVRWTLVQGTETSQWRGSAEEGPQGAADWFARVFATEAAGEGTLVAITVSGVSDLRAYAAVTDYLQSLTLVRGLAVDEVAGDNVVYRARVQGGGDRLARAISLGGRLEPVSGANGDASAPLVYRYRQ